MHPIDIKQCGSGVHDINNVGIKNNRTRDYCIKNWGSAAILTMALLFVPEMSTSAPASKQSNDEERWFEIELIVFAHKNGLALESEKWPEITGIELPSELIELKHPDPEPPEEEKTEEKPSLVFEPVITPGSNTFTETTEVKPIPMPVAYVMLDKKELQLNEAFKKIKRSKLIKPLLHIGWRQPTYNKKNAQSVLLFEGMDIPVPEITDEALSEKTKSGKKSKDTNNVDEPYEVANPRFVGTIQVSVARYLHLAADLIYRTPVTQRIATPLQALELLYDRPYPTLYDPQGPAYRAETWKAIRGFRLNESRRMRSKKIHYLDHPFLSIIALITPVELPKDPEEISAADPADNISSP